MARVMIGALRRVDLSWVRIEIALLVGAVLLAG